MDTPRLNVTDNQEIKELSQPIEESTIKCGDCGAILAHIIMAETNEYRSTRGNRAITTQYQVENCWKCGGSSFKTKLFNGSCKIGSAKDGMHLIDVATDIDKDGIIICKLALKND